MKTTEFKVHTIYSKDDILQMEKVSSQKLRRISLTVTGIVFVLYLAVVLWEASKGDGHASLFSFISGGVLDAILIIALLCTIVLMFSLPYLQRRKILKAVPGGILKANYYFYEKTFQYGWGNSFTSVAYINIQEFRNLANTFFIKADGVAYWIKKSDFEVGTPEEFMEFMKGKVKCKVL